MNTEQKKHEGNKNETKRWNRKYIVLDRILPRSESVALHRSVMWSLWWRSNTYIFLLTNAGFTLPALLRLHWLDVWPSITSLHCECLSYSEQTRRKEEGCNQESVRRPTFRERRIEHKNPVTWWHQIAGSTSKRRHKSGPPILPTTRGSVSHAASVNLA